MMKKIAIGTVLLLAAGGAAFTALGGMNWLDEVGLRGEDRQLRTRVHGYWDARVEGKTEQMAAYIHPLQSEMLQPGMLVTEGYELKDLVIEGDEALATLTVTSRLRHPIFGSRTREVEVKSKWVRYEDGKWYRDVRPVGIYEAIQYSRGQWQPPTRPAAPAEDEPVPPESQSAE